MLSLSPNGLADAERRGEAAVAGLDSLLAPYHGIHPAPGRGGCQRLDWHKSIPRADRVRVREHTCECRTVFYELCATAGVMFIRRYHRKSGVTTMQETAWLRAAKGEQLWAAILSGSVR